MCAKKKAQKPSKKKTTSKKASSSKKKSSLSPLKKVANFLLGEKKTKSKKTTHKKTKTKTTTTSKADSEKTRLKKTASKKKPRVSKASKEKKTGQKRTFSKAAVMICREVACEVPATTGVYCRLHYIKNWKKIKRKIRILKEKKLDEYIEELVGKYPEKYMEIIRQDLGSDKDFSKVIEELELTEPLEDFDSDIESIDQLIDNIRRDLPDDDDFNG